MPASAVDLTNCDREPIHIPGAIQAHGVLLVITEPDMRVIQASANTAELLELGPVSILGSCLSDILGEPAANMVRTALHSRTLHHRPYHLSNFAMDSRPSSWAAAIHRDGDAILLELQPNGSNELDSSQAQDLVREAVADLDTCDSLPSFCQAATVHFRKLTQFDRVMVYRFLEDDSGVVIAESCAPEMESYRGLHYPASDIPRQARNLYLLNPFRLTADVNAPAVPLSPSLNPLTNQPLDLSFTALRATSPIHLEYLRNMDVSASLSFSIIHHDRLWGLVACHHRSAHTLSSEVRIAGEILTRFVELQVGNKEEAEHKDYARRLAAVRSGLRDQLSRSGEYVAALVTHDRTLLSEISAGGLALCTGSQTILQGRTPNEEQVRELCRWIQAQPWQSVWSTDSLSGHYSAAQSLMDSASGILVLRVAPSSPETVIWFRPELPRTVQWAGNPAKPTEQASMDGQLRLHPRKSFALWKEQVSGRSAPWQAIELEHARELREDMAQALLAHRALEVSRLNEKLLRSNEDLEQFAAVASHDLQEPLRTISVYTELLFRKESSISDPAREEMIQFVLSATKRMSALIRSLLEYARNGSRETSPEGISIAGSLQQALSNLQAQIVERDAEFTIGELAEARAHHQQLARVFQNLIGNALKYCPSDRKPRIAISAARQGGMWLVSVQDNGPGFESGQSEKIFQSFYRASRDQAGTGLGLAICRKIIQSFGGRIWADSTPGAGATFQFTLPIA